MLARAYDRSRYDRDCDEAGAVVFDGREHITLITFGMRERPFKVVPQARFLRWTAGRRFSSARRRRCAGRRKGASFIPFTRTENLQVAVDYGLGKPADYFYQMRKELARSRDPLTDGLESIGFPVLRRRAPLPHGRPFAVGDLTRTRGVLQNASDRLQGAAIPVSAFYEKEAGDVVVRFCLPRKMHSRPPRGTSGTRCTADKR